MDDLGSVAEKIASIKSTKFLNLIKVYEFDPETDFVDVDLRNSDFSYQDVSKFNFSGSLLTGSNTKGAKFSEQSLTYAIFFDPKLMEQLKPYRYLINRSVFSRRYYERIANFATLAICNPKSNIFPIGEEIVANDISKYASHFAYNVLHIIESNEMSENTKSLEIARIARKQTYPLDRQKYYRELEKLQKMYSKTVSFI